jgi:hypothetical protein
MMFAGEQIVYGNDTGSQGAGGLKVERIQNLNFQKNNLP